MSTSTTLTLTGLEVAFGARTLVTGLDLVLSAGDVTALVGANGSGKSSLMRTVVGELPVEAGSVRLAPADATIGWLPQTLPEPGGVAARLRPAAYRRRRGRPRPRGRRRRRWRPGLPGADEEYAAALERWLALGAADLDDRLPQVAGQLGLDVDPDRPLGLAVRRPGGARRARLGAAQQVRRAAARRADQQPRRARAGADGGLRHRPRRAGAGRQPRPRLPRPGRHPGRRARPRPAAGRPLHRRLVGLRRRPGPRAPAGARGVRGVRRRARPARRAGPAARGLGGEGAPQRGERATSPTSTSARSSRPAPTGRPARRRAIRKCRRPARGGGRSRARSGSCATRSRPGRRPPRSCGPSTGSR